MSATQKLKELWEDPGFASRYRFAEVITGPYAKLLVEQTGIQSTKERPLVILDNACGTGVVADKLQRSLDEEAISNMQLTCADISEVMLGITKKRIQEEGWKNVETKIVDAQKTDLPSSHYSHVFASFVIMALPEPSSALNECLRILKPGGTIAFSTWKKSGWFADLRDAVAEIPGNLPFPSQQEFLEAIGKGHWDDEKWIATCLRDHGFEDISVRPAEESVSVDSHDDFIAMLSSMIPLITSRFWNEEQRQTHEKDIAPVMRAYLERKYGKGQLITTDWIAVLSTAKKPM
ncbi:UbiE/COQ5 family methyltransferase, putative [Paecilomyces variotii No. 5]|uniref:UbiE/COQ5 family methyltransferase, putative n=1 Tax=Byssochlamys spectabilis (strain No. 5 / NBRC 109023) TaxID=1356009 RepID=V5HVT0_BYSSN|nr:UbiE/COQ5 family methyltransferase, putative [Paecilomyces variotii No. 5]